MPSQLIIGLTGGIGSGKTTVANLFAQQGVPVVDADQITKTLLQPCKPIYQAILRQFGATILNPDQTLKRSLLRQIIIEQADKRHWLEKLIHPQVKQIMTKKIAHIHTPYCLLVIPLLIENLPHPLVQRILVIDTLPDLQRKRVKIRDQFDETTIDRIIAIQAKRDQRLAYADDVLENNGNLDDLHQAVIKHHQFYRQLTQK